MPEFDRLNGFSGWIDLGFVEKEATPELLIKLSIQLHLADLSLSNTVSILGIFGVERARSTVHNWVHKADLQPEDGRKPDRVAVDETVIRIDGEQFGLYAAVDPESNKLLHTKLEPTTTKVLARSFIAEHREKHDVDDAVFLTDNSASLQSSCQRHGLDFRYEQHGNRNAIERVFREIKRRTSSFSNSFSHVDPETADDWLRSLSMTSSPYRSVAYSRGWLSASTADATSYSKR